MAAKENDSNPLLLELFIRDLNVENSDAPVNLEEANIAIFEWMEAIVSKKALIEAGGRLKLVLNFSSHSFTADGARQIAHFFRMQWSESSVVAIGLSGAHGADALNAVATLGKSLAARCERNVLIKLDNVDDTSIQAFLPLLKGPSVQHVYMFNVNLSGHGMNDVEAALTGFVTPRNGARAYRPCDKLTHVNIMNNPSGDIEGAMAFAAVVKKCKALVNVRYANCNPGKVGSEAIVNSVTYLSLEAPNLCYVDLQGLHLGHVSDQMLGALLKFSSLEHVDLRDCQLSASQVHKYQYKLCIANDSKLLLAKQLHMEIDYDIEDNVEEFDMSQQVARG